jgi:adenylate cyclase
MRHLARGGGVLRELNDLRGPMGSVLDFFVRQREELERYKQRFGELPADDSAPHIYRNAGVECSGEGDFHDVSGLVGEVDTDDDSDASSSRGVERDQS